jgi:glutamate-1-semialdehyde 2,1-aminomutase
MMGLYTEPTMTLQTTPNRTKSQTLQQRAERYFPGGVNSPVRAFRAVGGNPPFVESGEGAYLIDADGNRFIDYFGSWGPMILGHAFPPAVEAIKRAADRSASFGASTAAEAGLAERIVDCYPAIEKMRFVSSGTEATMSAIRLARAATGRNIIVKFEGCYHGHSDGLLVKAGSGVATFGIPGSAGVPDAVAHLTLALPYNNLVAVESAFGAHSGAIAGVILEPVVGNAGCIPPADGFLEGLRQITSREGALLIVDEVMTGFRLALGGAVERYGMDPDLITLGKIVGGGLPVGVFGGKKELMDLLSPLGPVYQAGTLSGNPLAMAAGMATVDYLQKHAHEVYPRLEATSKAVADGVAAEAARAGIPLTTNRIGAMWTWFFNTGPVKDYDDAANSDMAAFGRFHRAMMGQGVWLPPSQFEAAFLSTAHGEEEVAATVTAAGRAFEELAG